MENSKKIKGIEYAAKAISLTSTNPNRGGRKAMANAAVKIGNYTDEAKALWVEYINNGCPHAA